jgi:hypothetical protein
MYYFPSAKQPARITTRNSNGDTLNLIPTSNKTQNNNDMTKDKRTHQAQEETLY